jgi:hypothetical protein
LKTVDSRQQEPNCSRYGLLTVNCQLLF